MSVEFEPVKLGRRRWIDPVVIGVAGVALLLVVAVVKPWADTAPETTASAVPTILPSTSEPEPSPALADALPLTWADVAQVVSRREAWGIRTIVLDPSSQASSGASPPYKERWSAIGGSGDTTAVVDGRDGIVVALGVTFPLAETPLDVRIWLDHGGRDLEWIDARPVNDVPARGAYLFVRGGLAEAALRPWEPGRYRVDVLVGGDIRRIDLEILDRTGALPDPEGFVRVIPRLLPLPASGLEGLPVGLFASSDGASVSLPSTAGPALDEAEGWLDLDRRAADQPGRSFVARTYQPRATRLGVVLPPSSTIRSATLLRLAPFRTTAGIVGEATAVSGEAVSFVAFATPGGAIWHPGVYALRVEWEDGDGAHDLTWHAELRPGPVAPDPVLLSATRAWASLAGSDGVVLGWPNPVDGAPAPPDQVALSATLYRARTIGCGDAAIRAGATVLGFVGPETVDLAPVSSVIQFPFADVGPMPVLTAAGAVPGLAVAAPVLTAELDGPAAYGFRAGSMPDAPGYTICIGLAAPGG